MYILSSKNKPSIVTHICNTIELANVVKNYIESRHDCTIEIVERPGLIYYDAPGIKYLHQQLFDIDVGKVCTGIENVNLLMVYFEKEPDFNSGFMRIPSFQCHLCLTKEEFEETKKYIHENKATLNGYINQATKIIIGA